MKLSMTYFDSTELAGLDAIIKGIEQSTSHDNAELVKQLAGFSIKLKGDVSDILATDPQSDAYIDKVKRVHEEIIGKRHSRDLEGMPGLNLEYESNWPYPWGTQCPETVGRFLISYGFLIRSAALPRGARVLEVGCGMGSLTWNLARMGYRVDAIDPNPAQCDSVRAFTAAFPVPPTVIPATLDEWLRQRDAGDKYDAVIFFESFHHLMDHQACLRTLLDQHMQPDGKIILAAEPIHAGINDVVPYPWGPRLDGESLRAMRNWGWLELGFTEAYVRELFHQLGMGFQWFKSAAAPPHSELIVGSRASFGQELAAVTDNYPASLEDGIDLTRDGLPEFLAGMSGMSPWESWGRWSDGAVIKLEFKETLPEDFELQLQLVDVFGPNLGQELRVKAGAEEKRGTLKNAGQQPVQRFRFQGSGIRQIEIVIPQPTRPRDVTGSNSDDARELGIALRSIKIEAGKARGLLGRLFN